jgi:hypothetical protein
MQEKRIILNHSVPSSRQYTEATHEKCVQKEEHTVEILIQHGGASYYTAVA